MKTIRFILLFAALSISLTSCRKTADQEKQDVVEDINDAFEPLDKTIKEIKPENKTESEDEMIQNEINRLQDSISN